MDPARIGKLWAKLRNVVKAVVLLQQCTKREVQVTMLNSDVVSSVFRLGDEMTAVKQRVAQVAGIPCSCLKLLAVTRGEEEVYGDVTVRELAAEAGVERGAAL